MKTKTSSKILFLTSMIIFSTIGIFTRMINTTPCMIALWRGSVGTLFLILAAFVTKSKISYKSIFKNIIILAISGVFIGLNWILLFKSYSYISISLSTICYYFAPIFVIILSSLFFKERLTIVKFICVVFSLIGVFFISGIIKSNTIPSFEFKGLIFGFSAAFLYSIVVILNKAIKNVSAYERAISQLFFATIGAFLYLYFFDGLTFGAIDRTSVILLIIVGVIHTGIAYTLYFGAIKNMKGQEIAFYSYLDPVLAIVFSTLLLNEKIDLFTIIGAVLILGSALINDAKG